MTAGVAEGAWVAVGASVGAIEVGTAVAISLTTGLGMGVSDTRMTVGVFPAQDDRITAVRPSRSINRAVFQYRIENTNLFSSRVRRAGNRRE